LVVERRVRVPNPPDIPDGQVVRRAAVVHGFSARIVAVDGINVVAVDAVACGGLLPPFAVAACLGIEDRDVRGAQVLLEEDAVSRFSALQPAAALGAPLFVVVRVVAAQPFLEKVKHRSGHWFALCVEATDYGLARPVEAPFPQV
jgi:hypothetical protein